MDKNNPFGNISSDGLEQAQDRLGGNFGPLESAVYTGEIKAAYAGKSQGGAHSMNFVVALEVDGQPREYREIVYVTNKQGQNFYERDGKKNPLPGYTTANDICLVTTGHELNAQDFEEKVIKVYDFTSQSEVPTKVQMAVNLIGQKVTLAILRQTVDKNVKDASGNYVPSGETRDENVIDKVFHTDSGRTVSEIVRKLDSGEFLDQWSKKNTGVTRNKAKGTGGKSGAPGQAASPASNGAAAAGSKPKSLFG